MVACNALGRSGGKSVGPKAGICQDVEVKKVDFSAREVEVGMILCR
jgi:hypothetical protein